MDESNKYSTLTDVKDALCYKCKYWEWGIIPTNTSWLWQDTCTKELKVLVTKCEGFENAHQSEKNEGS